MVRDRLKGHIAERSGKLIQGFQGVLVWEMSDMLVTQQWRMRLSDNHSLSQRSGQGNSFPEHA